MVECPFCHHKHSADDVAFCAQCGSRLASGSIQSSVSERLKFWGGELRMLSIFFVSFKGLEKLMDERADRDIMSNLRMCMNEVEEIIKSFKGTSNQIIPDNRILGIFGAPKAHKDDPMRSVRCARQIKEWWKKQKSDIDFMKEVDLVIGINTGRAFFGYILEKFSFLTVIGDTINTAARLTEICPPDEMVMTESTYERVKGYVDVEHIGERSVRGKRIKVNIYLIKDIKEESEIPASQKVRFCGREAELNKLKEIAESIKRAEAKFCVISGQMGIGKTRLKEEFGDYIANDDSFNFIETQCSVEVQSPYYPFSFMLKQYFGLNEFDSKEVVAKRIGDSIAGKRLSPLIAKGLKHLFVTNIQRLRHDEMVAINEEIYTSIKNLIRYECHISPLVLIFEDFNKADDMSKFLVAYLASELRSEPVMFLMVNISKDFVANVDRPIEEINLTSLSQEETKELVVDMLGDVDDKLVEFLHKSAGGNPLFTIEAVRNTRRTELIKKVTGRWILEKEQKLSFLDDLYGVAMSTIDSLSAELRLIVDYASVIGYNFSLRILAEIFGREDLREQLNYLVDEGYVILSKNDKDPVYVFRHNLLKDTAYNVLPVRKRKEIHKQVANLFEELYVDQLSGFYENIAHHYLSCEDFKKAASYFGLAGDKAKNLYAIEQALSFYSTVLKIDKETGFQIDRNLVSSALLHLSDLYEIAGDIQKMEKNAEQGLYNARMYKDTEYELRFTERYAYALFLVNKFAEAEELLLGGVDQCDEKMADILSVLHSDLGILYQQKNECEKSVLHYNLSWNTARNSATKKGEVLCLFNLSQLHKNLGNYEQALEYLDYGLNDLIKADDMRWLVQFKYLIADIDFRVGDLKKSKEILLECLKTADDIGNIETYLKSALDLAVINSMNGDSKKVNEYLQLADAKVSFMIRESLLAEINLKKAIICHRETDQKRAKDFITSALKTAQKFNQRETEFYCYHLLSFVESKTALEHAHKALDIAKATKLPPLVAAALSRLTQIYTEENDLEKARYYGRKALYIHDDIKLKLKEKRRQAYVHNPEYTNLLEI